MSKGLRVSLRIGILSAMCLPVFAGVVVNPTTAPEPATIGLIGAGLAAVVGIRYYRGRKR